MGQTQGKRAPSRDPGNITRSRAFLKKLRGRRMIQTAGAFIGVGWLTYEIVHWVLVSHYRLPEELLDITIITFVGGLVSALTWRWFRGSEKRPGSVKVEVLAVPPVILTTVAVDLHVVLGMAGVSGKDMFFAGGALCLAVAWILFKSLQWAAQVQGSPRPDLPGPAINELGREKSIVVLPFKNISPEKGQEYFSDGLTEELIAQLSKIRSLRVISRTSAMLLKNSAKRIPVIARELNVQFALEGSVRRAGDEVRITAQLIDAVADTHIWAKQYAGTLGDIFLLQEKLARRITEALRLNLTPEEEQGLSTRRIPTPHALEVWLKAKQEWRSISKEGLDRAEHLLKDALATVGENALFCAGLAWVYYLAYDMGFRYEENTLLEIERYAARSIELDPWLAEAQYAMGFVRFKRGDLQGFVRHATRAMELEPNGDGLSLLAASLAFVGKIPEARRYAEDALRLDPLIYMPSFARAVVDLFDGQPEAALVRLRKAEAKLAPGQPFVNWWLAQAAAYAGREDEAREVFNRVSKMGAGLVSDLSELSRRALDGDRRGVLEVLNTTLLREITKTDEWYPCLVAAGLARVGETDEALLMLERAVSWGFSNYRFLAEYDRFLEPLRGNPRFEALVHRAREKQRRFEV